MIVGPTVRGQLFHFSEQFSFWASADLTVLALLIVMVTVPGQTKDPKRVTAAAELEKEKGECVCVCVWSGSIVV